MAIKVKPTLTPFSVGGNTVFRLVTDNPEKTDETKFLIGLSDKIKLGCSQCRAFLDGFRDTLFENLTENKAVDLGFMYAKLYATGSLTSLTEQPTKERNPVKACIWLRGELADQIARIECVNDTKSVEAVLYEIMQEGASGTNRIESTTALVTINGSLIALDPTQTDTGVCLTRDDSDEVVAVASVSYSDQSVIRCTFPTLPETGRYRLVIATRNAQDPKEFVPCKLTRRVQVVNA